MSAIPSAVPDLPPSAAGFAGMAMRMEPSPVLWVRMRTEASRTAAVLPRGVRPALPGTWILAIARFTCVVTETRTYQEWSAFVPTSRGLWIAEMYIDDVGGLVMGREAFGMPKRLAELRVEEGRASMRTASSWGHASWTDGAALSSAELAGEMGPATTGLPGRLCAQVERIRARFGLPRPPVRMLARRVVPAVGGGRPIADELVSVAFRATSMDQLRRADARVELPADHVLGGRVEAAWMTRIAFDLAGARRLRSYR